MAILFKMWISLNTGDLLLLFDVAHAWSHGLPGHLFETFSNTLDPHTKQRSAADCWSWKLLSSGCGMKELVHLHVGSLGLFVLTVC